MFGLSSATFTKALKQLQEILAMARQKGLLGGDKKGVAGMEEGMGGGAAAASAASAPPAMKKTMIVSAGAAAKARAVCPSTKATEYIALPLSRLPLPRLQMEHMTTVCTRLAEKVEELGLGQENMPPSLAAGCVAFVVKRTEGVDISMAQLAEVADISIATLQKCLRRLEAHASDLEALFT
jgi:hypothetical protein